MIPTAYFCLQTLTKYLREVSHFCGPSLKEKILAWKHTQCLKITDKVSFNIAIEASYVYILSGQKLLKNAQKWSILASFCKPVACGETALPEGSIWVILKRCVAEFGR